MIELPLMLFCDSFILLKVEKIRQQLKKRCPNTALFPGGNSLGLRLPGGLTGCLAVTSPTPTAVPWASTVLP